MAIPSTSKQVIHALQNLSRETGKNEKEALLRAGLREILRWFTLAAKNIVDQKIKLPKQTSNYMIKHKDDIKMLADPDIDEEVKRKIILKPGGGGFLGGVIIRSLLRWDGEKTARKFGADRKKRIVIDERFVTDRRRKSKSKPKPKKKTQKKRQPKQTKRKQSKHVSPRRQLQFQSIPSNNRLGSPPYTAKRATDLYDIAPFSPLNTVPLSSPARTALGALYSNFS